MNQENQTRENILLTALTLFSQRGYDNVGVQEIVDAAKTAKPTLYYYFKSKSGLLRTILEEHAGPYASSIKKAAAYSHDFVKHLTDILHCTLYYAQADKDFFLFSNSLSIAPSQNESYLMFKPYKEEIEKTYLELFKASVKEFGNMKGFEAFYAKSYQASVNSFCISVINGEIEASDMMIQKLVKAFLYGAAN